MPRISVFDTDAIAEFHNFTANLRRVRTAQPDHSLVVQAWAALRAQALASLMPLEVSYTTPIHSLDVTGAPRPLHQS
jgi:hypothetical protein